MWRWQAPLWSCNEEEDDRAARGIAGSRLPYGPIIGPLLSSSRPIAGCLLSSPEPQWIARGCSWALKPNELPIGTQSYENAVNLYEHRSLHGISMAESFVSIDGRKLCEYWWHKAHEYRWHKALWVSMALVHMLFSSCPRPILRVGPMKVDIRWAWSVFLNPYSLKTRISINDLKFRT